MGGIVCKIILVNIEVLNLATPKVVLALTFDKWGILISKQKWCKSSNNINIHGLRMHSQSTMSRVKPANNVVQ